MRRMIATTKQNIVADNFNPTTKFTSCADIPPKANNQAKDVEVAIINKIIAEPFAESKKI